MTTGPKINHRSQRHAHSVRLLGVASAVLATALATQSAQAQSLQPNTTASERTVPEGEIVVTAQKREEPLQKVPISIAVLSGRELDRQATGGTLDALVQVPGIASSTSDAGNMTAISIRGVSAAVPFGDGSSTVGYYIDSIPFGLVRSAAVPNTNDFDMSRIEVLRGPQGTLYGASALNGVVHIVTNDADPTRLEFKFRTGISATQGGDPSYRGDAEINIPIIQDKLAIRLVGGVEDQGGWIDQPVRGITNANTTLVESLRIKIDARPTDNLKIDLTAWLSHEHEGAASYADAAGNQNTPLAQPERTNFGAYNAKIVYDLPFMSISSATSELRFNQTLNTDFSYYTTPAQPDTPGIRNYQLYSNLPASVFSEELLLNSKGNGPWRWSAGFFYRNARDDRYQTLPFALPGPIAWSDRSKSTAEFGQITRTFDSDHFELSAGLRHFHDNIGTLTLEPAGSFLPPAYPRASFNAVTPRVVATWLPDPRLTVYASYSEGFRSGLEQSPLTLLSAPLAPANPDRLHNYEVGAKGSLFDGFATFDTSVYYIKWNDVQQAGQVVYNGVYISATINGPAASGVGADVGLTLHPMRGLQIGGNFSYNGLKFDQDVLQNGLPLYFKGDRLAYSPEFTGNAFVAYAFALNQKFDVHANLSGNYRSKELLNLQGGNNGGAELVNGNSIYFSDSPFFLNGNFELANHANQSISIFAQNLTNWKGVLIPSSEPTTPFRPRPRTVGIQFQAKF